jgi:hypothetical protein
MKTKAWLTATSTAKHWSQHQHALLYQQSIPSITSIRTHLPSSSVSVVDSEPNSTSKPKQQHQQDQQDNNHVVTIAKAYYPKYKQQQQRLFASSAIHKNVTCQHPLISPLADNVLFAPPQKTLQLLDFFSQSYAKPVPSYIFAHGASGFAKRQRYTTPDSKQNNETKEQYYSTQIGEDAYFRRSDALGVADGVGGWAGVSGMRARIVWLHIYMY